MPFHFLLKGTSNGMFLRQQPFRNVTASVTSPDDSRLPQHSTAFPPKWTSQLGRCCCIFDSCIKLKNFSKTVHECLYSQHSARVTAALLVPGVPNEGFPWWILAPILGRNIGVSNLEDAILCFLIWINLLPSVLWLLSALCVKLQLLGVWFKWGKLLDTSQSLNSAAFLFSNIVA